MVWIDEMSKVCAHRYEAVEYGISDGVDSLLYRCIDCGLEYSETEPSLKKLLDATKHGRIACVHTYISTPFTDEHGVPGTHYRCTKCGHEQYGTDPAGLMYAERVALASLEAQDQEWDALPAAPEEDPGHVHVFDVPVIKLACGPEPITFKCAICGEWAEGGPE